MSGRANLYAAFVTALPEVDGARCKGEDPQLWDDAVQGETLRQRANRHAVAQSLCIECPARTLCLDVYRELARARKAATGVWGGMVFASSVRTKSARSLLGTGEVK